MPIDAGKWKNITEAKEAFIASKQKYLKVKEDSLAEMDAREDMENILWWVLENYGTDTDALLWVFHNSEDDSPVFDALMEKMDPKNISFY